MDEAENFVTAAQFRIEQGDLARACLYLNEAALIKNRSGQYYSAMLLRERVVGLSARILAIAKDKLYIDTIVRDDGTCTTVNGTS